MGLMECLPDHSRIVYTPHPVTCDSQRNFAAPLVEDLAFPQATGFAEVPADSYNVKVVAAPSGASTVMLVFLSRVLSSKMIC